MLFQYPHLLWLLFMLPAMVLLWLWRGGRVPAAGLGLRLAALTLLVLALAQPLWVSRGAAAPAEGPLVLLVDQSDSLDVATRRTLREQALALAQATGATAHILYFGADVVSGPLMPAPEEAGPPALMPDPAGSDLAAALRAARGLLPGGGRAVLLSDGQATTDATLLEAQQAAAAGLRVDVVPVLLPPRNTVALTGMQAPEHALVGETFEIVVDAAYAVAPGSPAVPLIGRLRLWVGTQLLADETLELLPGTEQFRVDYSASEPGVLRLQAELFVSDSNVELGHDRVATTVQVRPPPRVLLVATRSSDAALLGDALERQGIRSNRVVPSELPNRLENLVNFDAIVLLDVPATALTLDQMATVREFVRSEGRGLLVAGGRNAYTVGAYKDTPLEEVLPLRMEPPPRPQREQVALLLIVDRSASMSATFGVSKFDMAKEAAILSTESLRAEDRIGILAFDTGTYWVVSFQDVGDEANMAAIKSAIERLPLGGGTDIERALDAGLPALALQPTGVRHAVLLTDGRSFTANLNNYRRMIDTARANGITLSTIAIGRDADTRLLEQLADWGEGRYYYTDRAADIPRLTLLESEIARADSLIEGNLYAERGRDHPIMRDFAPADLPVLAGYVATTARDTAEVVLQAPEGDPLLAVWQYGLGRSVAWTPSLGPPWAEAWTTWEGFERFWAQAVRYALPEPESGPLQVRIEARPGGERLVVDALRPGGEPLDLARVDARITLPDGSSTNFPVGQSAPGRYTQDLSLTTAGAYNITVAMIHNGQRQEQAVGYVHLPPAEYRLFPDTAAGEALLEAIASTTGGTRLAAVSATTPSLPEQPLATASRTHLWPWLLALALVLWLAEIGVRRGRLGAADSR
ncbi:MAG: VWA domain-containing protein [Candidatus Viridilinea halotolerans]|uniref:VWA domain-containing protein n=1 Tax=Candidatus Viridilinea halotolerans TaxID=2491704 RepID=A0A426UBW5_9CHLR|nr:MAG: VWA domain-containing protein [Candidatus Viridilinea halotolerans]